jgi:hypothetical protein
LSSMSSAPNNGGKHKRTESKNPSSATTIFLAFLPTQANV